MYWEQMNLSERFCKKVGRYVHEKMDCGCTLHDDKTPLFLKLRGLKYVIT